MTNRPYCKVLLRVLKQFILLNPLFAVQVMEYHAYSSNNNVTDMRGQLKMLFFNDII